MRENKNAAVNIHNNVIINDNINQLECTIVLTIKETIRKVIQESIFNNTHINKKVNNYR
jgi:hypothetical protein